MKLIVFLALVFAFSLVANCRTQAVKIQEVQADSDAKVKEAIRIFDEFFDNLRAELMKAIQKNQFDGAISVCKEISPAMERSYSEKYKMKIYRISDKYRNPDHKPTPDEMEVLNYWQEKMKQNQELKAVYFQVGNKTKVMKPIKTFADLCLQCHGDPAKMNPAVLERIKKEYPDDKAVGYKLNDLRGAFVAEF
ncbi:MAG: DUF3365 domain-containing protein [Leptospiraceae bacterium]|nr:DUF3365 domain-containing protein [Leptospiraceae bacterium]